MTAGSPQVAVVIPTTTGRETRLAFALEALAGQTLDRGRFEVLVVCAFDRTRGSLIEVPSGLSVRLPAAWGEDTDLGLRATELGAELRYVDGALVWHAVVPRPLPVALKDTRRRGSTAAVVARHPVHRGELYGRLFAHERHAKLLLAALTLLLAWRRPALAAPAGLPYLNATYGRGRVTPRGLARLATHLPSRVAVDIVETVVTVH